MMKTSTTRFCLFAILCTIFFPVTSASCPSFVTSNDDCSASVFDGDGDIVADCAEDGSSLSVSGNVTFLYEFSQNATVSAVPCWLGFMCFGSYAQDLGGVCDHLTNVDGDACGTAGTYTFSETTYDLPDNNIVKSMMGMATVEILVDADLDCISALSSPSAQFITFAAVPALVGVTLYMRYRRRRQRPLLNLEGADERFVEMKDVQKYGQMV